MYVEQCPAPGMDCVSFHVINPGLLNFNIIIPSVFSIMMVGESNTATSKFSHGHWISLYIFAHSMITTMGMK